MPKYLITPLIGVGPIRFGMHRDEVRAAMQLPAVTFQKAAGDPTLTDAFFDSCLQVFYDAADMVEYIEVSRNGPVVAIYNRIDVFAAEADQLLAQLRQVAAVDEDDPEIGYSYIFPELELSVWRPVRPEEGPEGQYFATIGVGKSGYYSS